MLRPIVRYGADVLHRPAAPVTDIPPDTQLLIDDMGIAYHANYLVWFEVGRTEWLREGGWTYRALEEDGVSLPVIEAHCEYRHPARYDDEIEISTKVTVMSPVRIRFDYEARLTGRSTLAATGHTVHAALGADGRPRRLPSRVLEYLK